MKNIIVTVIFLFAYNIYAQEKKAIFVDDKQDYVVFLDKDVKVSNRDIQGTEVDVFAKTKDKKFNYTLLVSKIFEHNFTKGNLLDESYESYYLSTCGCSIIDKEIIYYNNLKTLRYKIKTVNGDNTFIGYNDSFVSNGLLYNVLFLAFENDFDEESVKYSPIMNTLIINGRTTIDNYSEYGNVSN
ncbi:hypothetical protein [Xanthomarina gelatinilytica]|uniref:hypothetical protein n=1 Tax=Xanthomarina gelatinilytica TaxID=1137281 RepID=UPI003AA842D6